MTVSTLEPSSMPKGLEASAGSVASPPPSVVGSSSPPPPPVAQDASVTPKGTAAAVKSAPRSTLRRVMVDLESVMVVVLPCRRVGRCWLLAAPEGVLDGLDAAAVARRELVVVLVAAGHVGGDVHGRGLAVGEHPGDHADGERLRDVGGGDRRHRAHL